MKFKKLLTGVISIVVITAIIATGTILVSNAAVGTLTTIKSIKLNKTSASLYLNKKMALKATVKYNSGSNTKEGYAWSSKNKAIATVSNSGVVTGKRVGTTYIICSSASGNVKARCKVTVRLPYNKVKSITFTQSVYRLNRKDKRSLSPIVRYSSTKHKSNEPIAWKSSNKNVATVKKGVVKGKKNGSCYITAVAKFTGTTKRVKVTVANTKYIAFTFDDGPGDYTDKLLGKLKQYNAKATFFVLGNLCNTYKKQLKRENAYGMEIGSHSYSHQNLKKLSGSAVKKDLSKTRASIKKQIGRYPTVFRPPYGNYNKKVSKYAYAPMIYWSVDTLDWKYRNANTVKRSILKQAGKWEIVLLHDIHKTSVNGFIKALPVLKKRGYELVTVHELYKIYGAKLKNGKMYYGPVHDQTR